MTTRSPIVRTPEGVDLCRRLGLTQAEERVANALAAGLTYAEIAERLGLSYHTVHTHIKAIHRKAGVRTNARFLALIAHWKEDRV
jgi:DNA-binding CsgD family transcriptional regulator